MSALSVPWLRPDKHISAATDRSATIDYIVMGSVLYAVIPKFYTENRQQAASIPCRPQAEVIQNHENEHVRGIGQGVSRHRKYMRLKT
jgi:hypothetical protein